MASRSWNRVELIGNLTRDPELRYTPNGAAVCSFGVATNRSYLVDGERKEEVDFHRVVAWNKLAELCNQLLKKGSRVFISGRLQYREWEPQEGQKRRDAEIVLEDMLQLTPKSSMGEEGASLDESLPQPPSDEAKTASEPKEKSTAKKETDSGEKLASQEEQNPVDETVSDNDLPF